MSSTKLRNAATDSKFEFTFDLKTEPCNIPPSLRAEFIDGSIWLIETGKYDSNELRSLFFEKAAAVEDSIERAGSMNYYSDCTIIVASGINISTSLFKFYFFSSIYFSLHCRG